MSDLGTRPPRPSVLIADDHVVVATGLALTLAPYFTIAGVIHDLDRLLGAVARTRPQVVLLDLSFNGRSSLATLRALSNVWGAEVRVVILTAHDSVALQRAALDAGAIATLQKGIGPQDLRLAIEAAAEGRPYVTDATKGLGGEEDGDRNQPRMVAGVSLTDRQRQVVYLLSTGASRTGIAGELGITR